MVAMQELRDGGSVAMLSAVNDLYELLTFNEVMQDISIKDTEIMDNMKAPRALWKQIRWSWKPSARS